ncbi:MULTISPECIES: CHAP domain-containing protein [unclassified Rhodococcus (in: high G+C Gram-positive bacteria)]|uniref:CHAP domain-containing protein n=1 Tax=unclassified Rhodococcus (in: high G+C Gram-positive bacteria) TaxID=192944 RepID=UPI0006F54AD2|nr:MULTISPECIES: CHAP domain-containing protein [unclassified Rhodococcus (in: high G+C Gram-positive bacteria)]KQU30583.1 hypothetical protein ASG69_06165 [Rhodococcus sp. Leaf225]KQU44515.1 hypothetical protein ASH03_10975 [Rhodococcus sp. Leaf258]
MPTSTRVRRTVAGVVALAVVAVAAVLWTAPERWYPWDTADFPAADASLSPAQQRVLEVVEREYRDPRPATFYSEGVDEAWCADFVSHVMRQAGQPFTNPHSGGLRIPGVYTLTEYYQEQGRFAPVGDHSPAVGDVVLYESGGPVGDLLVGQHTNIVVAVDGDTVTTVGGNEMGGIRIHDLDWADDSAVLGFGLLGS